jgi:trans-aconitate methyltransferase
MPRSPSDEYLKPYRQALKQFGPGFKATLWGSRDTQVLRFDVMIELADFRRCNVLDVGCGRGDFAARLLEREVPFERYVGLDALKEMIKAAAKRDLERCTFAATDVLKRPQVMADAEPDWVCFSGTLNTMDDDTARGLVRTAFEVASQGVVFNFLSDRCHAKWADRDLAPARRFDTAAWLDWAMGLTSRVAFTQAYLDGHDATILLQHEG